MNGYYYWLIFLFFIIAIVIFAFVDIYAGLGIFFFFFILIIFYYTLDSPDVTKATYMRKVNPDGSETVVKKVEEVDNDLYPESASIVEEVSVKKRGRGKKSQVEKTVTVEQTSDYFGDTETVETTVVTPKKRRRKTAPKKKKTSTKKKK